MEMVSYKLVLVEGHGIPADCGYCLRYMVAVIFVQGEYD